jgi:porin
MGRSEGPSQPEFARAFLSILATTALFLVAGGPLRAQTAPDVPKSGTPSAQPPPTPAVTDPTKPTPPPAAAKPGQGPSSPLTFTGAYTADFLGDVAGGQSSGGGYADLLKVSAAYDGSASGQDGLTGLISLEHQFGSDFTATRVGGVQAVSATEALPGATRLYEAWVQQTLLNGQGAVKAGFVDLNSTFDVQETAALFLNASDGIGPDIGDTGVDGPSDYPIPALAITAYCRPADDWTLQAGLFDGSAGNPAHRSAFVGVKFDGALLIGQVEKRFGDVARVEVGGWTYTSSFPSLTSTNALGQTTRISGNGGVYGLVEGQIMPAPGGAGGGLNGWVRAGLANGDINVVDSYLGGGLVYTGLFKDRTQDEIGVAISRAGIGAGARHVGALAGRDIGDAETVLEGAYRFVVKDWLNVEPDLQYVIDPHGDLRIPNAVVLALRVALTYSK